MNISAINNAVRANATFGSAKTDAIKEQIKGLESKEPNEVVDYSNWGDNYPIPITAGQKLETLQAELKKLAAEESYEKPAKNEEPDWYKAQRFNSPEYLG